MDIQAIKLDLIHWLEKLNNPTALNQIKAIKESHDWWNNVSNEERLAIEEGLTQLDNHEGIPHETVMRRAKKKYNL